jgi:hypothetical protein
LVLGRAFGETKMRIMMGKEKKEDRYRAESDRRKQVRDRICRRDQEAKQRHVLFTESNVVKTRPIITLMRWMDGLDRPIARRYRPIFTVKRRRNRTGIERRITAMSII